MKWIGTQLTNQPTVYAITSREAMSSDSIFALIVQPNFRPLVCVVTKGYSRVEWQVDS